MRFIEAALGLRRWLHEWRAIPADGEAPAKITIEVSSVRAGHALLMGLKTELDPMIAHGADVDFDKPIKLMGIEFTFKIADPMRALDFRDVA